MCNSCSCLCLSLRFHRADCVGLFGFRVANEALLTLWDNLRVGSDDLRDNLSAAAHLIHGTSEGRFKITYCPVLCRPSPPFHHPSTALSPPFTAVLLAALLAAQGHVSKEDIESVGFSYGDLAEMTAK